jgi:hypothetical protein
MTRTQKKLEREEEKKEVKQSEALKTIWCTVWIIIMHFAVAPAFSSDFVYLSAGTEACVWMERISLTSPFGVKSLSRWTEEQNWNVIYEVSLALWQGQTQKLSNLRPLLMYHGIILINCLPSNNIKYKIYFSSAPHKQHRRCFHQSKSPKIARMNFTWRWLFFRYININSDDDEDFFFVAFRLFMCRIVCGAVTAFYRQ